jgi:hypothetical protein
MVLSRPSDEIVHHDIDRPPPHDLVRGRPLAAQDPGRRRTRRAERRRRDAVLAGPREADRRFRELGAVDIAPRARLSQGHDAGGPECQRPDGSAHGPSRTQLRYGAEHRRVFANGAQVGPALIIEDGRTVREILYAKGVMTRRLERSGSCFSGVTLEGVFTAIARERSDAIERGLGAVSRGGAGGLRNDTTECNLARR